MVRLGAGGQSHLVGRVMDWKQVGQSVAKFAPTLGAALGGPTGAGIGAIVASAFGAENSPVAVSAAVASSPDAAVRLREIELKHIEILSAIALERYQAEAADVQHAREAHKGHWMTWALTLLLGAMVGALTGVLILRDTPPANTEVVYLIAGQLLTAFLTCVAFWVGSSRGSFEKQGMIWRRG